MRAVGKAGHLAATAATAARAIDQKAAKGIPLLGCLLVDATDTVAFTGTDLNIQITTAAAAARMASSEAAARAAGMAAGSAASRADLARASSSSRVPGPIS